MSTEHPFAALLAEYVAECLPLAEDVLDRALALERAWAGGEEGADLSGPMKGLLHTIKGNSAMMGLGAAQELAHTLEDLAGCLSDAPACRPGGAALLVRGTSVLADLVRGAALGEVPADAAQACQAELRRFLAESAALPPEAPHPERRAGDRRSERRDRDGHASVRVDARRLDALLEIFGEAMIAQAGLRDAVKQVARRRRATAEDMALDQATLALERTLKRLEQALMETRLLPIGTVFGRFTRLVRDLARSEGKEVRLELAGGDTQLDKTVIDRLGEPLVHLVTNAIIHGIEPPAERAAQGKPPEAAVTLRAVQRGDRVILTVSDDGRGLDPEKILCKARALGLAPATERPALADVYAMAFLPGLSTANEVSALSGRGVGLDVVANALRVFSGHVSVTSDPGRGTSFTLQLPLTVAVLRSMLVEVDRERFAVPLADVAEAVRLDGLSRHAVGRQGMVPWRDEVIPVHDGGEILGGTAATGATRKYCVVLRAAARHRGLLVDSLLGHHDVVVKPLDPSLGRPPTVAAATILGDGRVACILDTARIADGITTAALASEPNGITR